MAHCFGARSSMRRMTSVIGFHVSFSEAGAATRAHIVSTRSAPANPASARARINPIPKCNTSMPVHSMPVHGQLARLHDHVFLLSRELHQVHQQLNIVFTVLANLFVAAVPPPLDDFQSIAGFLPAQRFS